VTFNTLVVVLSHHLKVILPRLELGTPCVLSYDCDVLYSGLRYNMIPKLNLFSIFHIFELQKRAKRTQGKIKYGQYHDNIRGRTRAGREKTAAGEKTFLARYSEQPSAGGVSISTNT
jgi:hypothetical protein